MVRKVLAAGFLLAFRWMKRVKGETKGVSGLQTAFLQAILAGFSGNPCGKSELLCGRLPQLVGVCSCMFVGLYAWAFQIPPSPTRGSTSPAEKPVGHTITIVLGGLGMAPKRGFNASLGCSGEKVFDLKWQVES